MKCPEMTNTPIDRLPPDVRGIADAMVKVLNLYIPCTTKIEMTVGRNITATLSIVGGPITREVIEDTMAHLAFYKRYYPKEAADEPRAMDSAEKILEALVEKWELHRSLIARAPDALAVDPA